MFQSHALWRLSRLIALKRDLISVALIPALGLKKRLGRSRFSQLPSHRLPDFSQSAALWSRCSGSFLIWLAWRPVYLAAAGWRLGSRPSVCFSRHYRVAPRRLGFRVVVLSRRWFCYLPA